MLDLYTNVTHIWKEPRLGGFLLNVFLLGKTSLLYKLFTRSSFHRHLHLVEEKAPSHPCTPSPFIAPLSSPSSHALSCISWPWSGLEAIAVQRTPGYRTAPASPPPCGFSSGGFTAALTREGPRGGRGGGHSARKDGDPPSLLSTRLFIPSPGCWMKFQPRVEAAQGGSRRSSPACPLSAAAPPPFPPFLPSRGPQRDSAVPAIKNPTEAAERYPRRRGEPPEAGPAWASPTAEGSPHPYTCLRSGGRRSGCRGASVYPSGVG